MDVPRIRTYVEGLDRHIEGGIPKGSITLICGTAGTMKSSLAYSILYNNAVNEDLKSVYITLEQEIESLMQQMRRLGMSDHRNILLVDFRKVQAAMEKKYGDNWIRLIRGYIEEAKKGQEYDLLVIDSLNALYSLTTIRDPRRELYYLFKDLKTTGITCFLISEMSPERPVYSQYGVEDFLADGIIHLDFQKRGDVLSALERYIGIVKMRSTNHDTQYFPILYSNGRFRVFGREELELE